MIAVLDVLALVVLGALFAGVAWLALRTVAEARFLDDPPARSRPESPGQRNDRQRLLGDR